MSTVTLKPIIFTSIMSFMTEQYISFFEYLGQIIVSTRFRLQRYICYDLCIHRSHYLSTSWILYLMLRQKFLILTLCSNCLDDVFTCWLWYLTKVKCCFHFKYWRIVFLWNNWETRHKFWAQWNFLSHLFSINQTNMYIPAY